MSEEMLLTVKQVAEIMHTNKTYVYALIHSGFLPAIKLGSYKVRRDALEKFLKETEGKELTMSSKPGKITVKSIGYRFNPMGHG